jgi:hypothetical protein
MNAPFSLLPEGHLTAIDVADVWLLPSMYQIMLDKVLRQGELLATLVANVLFVDFVLFKMPFKTVFSGKVGFTS